VTSCYNNLEFTSSVNGNSFVNICSCTVPVVPDGVTQSFLSEDCVNCFCYTITNSTAKNADFTYIACDGTQITLSIASEQVIQVCAQQFSVQSLFAVTIEGGISPCSVDGDCIIAP
jgi:hypothetical protein